MGDHSDDIPWVVMGDLNEISSSFERRGGSTWVPSRHGFLRMFMDTNSLLDIGFNGSSFTWVRRENNVVVLQERLDRCLLNECWIIRWPNSYLTHLARIGSDHNPILLKSDVALVRRKSTFRFEAAWADEEEPKKIITECWKPASIVPSFTQWNTNLIICRNKLRNWSKDRFPDCNKDEIKSCLVQLDDLQMNDPFDSAEAQSAITARLGSLWMMEEKYWHQRSRIKWLSAGDSNTRFFHLTTLHRRQRNRILKIQNDVDNWVIGEVQIRGEFEAQFQKLFTTIGPRDWGDSFAGVSPVVSDDMNVDLYRPFSLDEVRDASFQLGALKAPGPDGFPGLFYHKYWGIVNEIVMATSTDFLAGRVQIRNINQTHVVLIPKIPHPERTSHFRPISLCNNSYKILSKLLATRLKPILPSIISPNQNAFVSERLIQDNIMLAHEGVHYLRLKNGGDNHEFGLKLDMNKAYDRVEWDFLEATLIRFGFAVEWVNLVMACVSTVSFSIVLNGTPGSFFSPSRGLRQGDPLSPYLFLLVSEVLSLRLTKAVQDRSLLGVKLARSCPPLSHLFFADDSLFFMKATLLNCSRLSEIFKCYCIASGQLISKEKSSIFFSPNTPEQMQRLMCVLLGICGTEKPGVYLGLPTFWGRSKNGALAFIKERLVGKIDGWKQILLSQAGKEVLIKSVALAVPSYPMSCFRFPKGICDDMNAALGNFWWGSNGSGNKIHWKSWQFLGLPKEDGGMGFRDLHQFNLALVAKQAWRLITDPDTLWARVMKARYYPDCSFALAKKGYRASWGWSSLIEARDFITKNSYWQIISGSSVNIWNDCWIPPITNREEVKKIFTTGLIPSSAPILVEELIDWENRTWVTDGITHLVTPLEINRITRIPISRGVGPDRLIWPHTKCGRFSVKSAYHCLHHLNIITTTKAGSSHMVSKKCWKMLWKLPTLPKVKQFLWRALSSAVPTFLALFWRKINSSPMCPVCGGDDESMEHALLLCPWVEPVWFGSPLGLKINKQTISTLDKWLLHITLCYNNRDDRVWALTIICFYCWLIWKARCCLIYDATPLNPGLVIRKGNSAVAEFMSVRKPTRLGNRQRALVCWTPPQVDFVAVNSDASWIGTDKGGIGVIIRNHFGGLVGGIADQIRAETPEVAEALAILAGVNLAVELNLKNVEFRSDSRQVILDLQSNSTCNNWKTSLIIDQIKWKCDFFNHVRWDWTPREANRAAHEAAQLGNRTLGLRSWSETPPPSLTLVLRNDGLPCPHVDVF